MHFHAGKTGKSYILHKFQVFKEFYLNALAIEPKKNGHPLFSIKTRSLEMWLREAGDKADFIRDALICINLR